MADTETIRRAAALMREEHGPDHERHAMWSAMADHLDRVARRADEHTVGLAIVASAEVAARAYLDAPRVLPPAQCRGGIPSHSPPLERCTLPEGHEGECQ